MTVVSKLAWAAIAILVMIVAWAVYPQHHLALVGLYVLVTLAALFGLVVKPQRQLSANRNRYLRWRLHLKLHAGKGFATVPMLSSRFGRVRMLRGSKRITPDLSFWQRLRHPDAYSAIVGRAHWWYPVRIDTQTQSAWISVPRTGKTASLARRINHHTGSVVATSSQPDLYKLTSGARKRIGRVHVLNPSGLAGILSTFRWDILAGCQDAATAMRRADALINSVATGGTEGADWFKAKASDAMRALLVAGAISGSDFRAVARWILQSKLAEPCVILEQNGYAHFGDTLKELTGPAARTAGTILMFCSRAIQFASDPELLASVLPGDGDGLDLESLVRNRETLYLLAPATSNDEPLAGLFSALVAEIHHVALQVAARSPGGRLSPQLFYALDELCQVASGIPAARWAADAGGRGISMIVIAHGIAQLEERYGRSATRALLDCCACKVVYGGTSDPDTLTMFEKLCGDVAIKDHGHDSHARHPILPAEGLRELPSWYALLIVGNSPPTLVKSPRAWRDRTYRRLVRSGRAVAELTPAAAPKPMREVVTNGHNKAALPALPDLADWRPE